MIGTIHLYGSSQRADFVQASQRHVRGAKPSDFGQGEAVLDGVRLSDLDRREDAHG
jgi:hypothetical protein